MGATPARALYVPGAITADRTVAMALMGKRVGWLKEATMATVAGIITNAVTGTGRIIRSVYAGTTTASSVKRPHSSWTVPAHPGRS